MILIPKKKFSKSYKKLTPKLQDKVDIALSLFIENPLDERLHNHPLIGELSHLRSIDVTGDYRIWIHQVDEKTYEIVELIDIGTHAQLYG